MMTDQSLNSGPNDQTRQQRFMPHRTDVALIVGVDHAGNAIRKNNFVIERRDPGTDQPRHQQGDQTDQAAVAKFHPYMSPATSYVDRGFTASRTVLPSQSIGRIPPNRLAITSPCPKPMTFVNISRQAPRCEPRSDHGRKDVSVTVTLRQLADWVHGEIVGNGETP